MQTGWRLTSVQDSFAMSNCSIFSTTSRLFLLAFVWMSLLLTGGKLMAGEPLRYSVERQYVKILEADVIFLGRIESVKVSKPPDERDDPSELGPSRDVRILIKIDHVFSGEIESPTIEYATTLYFNVKPTLKKGDFGVFFMHRRRTDDGKWTYSSTYLAEDFFAPMEKYKSTSCSGESQILVVLMDETGKPTYNKTSSGEVLEKDKVRQLLEGFKVPGKGNVVCIIARDACAGYICHKASFLDRRWPY